MALVIGWYDFVCFGIVAVSFFGALWVIYRNEGGGRCGGGGGCKTTYESLLVARPEGDGYYVGGTGARTRTATSTGNVSLGQLWRSCWRGVHPGWILGLRLVSFLAMAGLLAWDVLKWDASIFIYYTEWTFALVMVYFAIGTVISAYGWREHSKRPPNEIGNSFSRSDLEEHRSTNSAGLKEEDYGDTIRLRSRQDQGEIEKMAGFFGYAMQILYQTCAGAVILTDVVFWCIIVPFLSNSHLGLNTLMGCMHTLNAVFLLLDTSVNSLPFPWFRLSYFVLWSCIYVVFQWFIHACGFPWWPYPFLKLSSPWAPLWYFCLALAHIPCYGAYSLLVKAKYSFFSRWFPHAFVCY